MLIKCISLIYKGCLWREGGVARKYWLIWNNCSCHKLLNLIHQYLLQQDDTLTGSAHFRHDIKTYVSSFIIAGAPHFSKWWHICLLLRLISSGVNKAFVVCRLNRWISNRGGDISIEWIVHRCNLGIYFLFFLSCLHTWKLLHITLSFAQILKY